MLSQTLQATHRPRPVVEELVRIGRRAIVSFPNFGFWRIRLRLLLTGQMPVSHCLAHPWYETPNIHLCTIRDFVALCDEIGVRVDRSVTLDRHGQPYSLDPRGSWPICSPSKASSSFAGAPVRNREIPMLIAHITDTHITSPGTLLMGVVDTASALERAVAALNRARSFARCHCLHRRSRRKRRGGGICRFARSLGAAAHADTRDPRQP